MRSAAACRNCGRCSRRSPRRLPRSGPPNGTPTRPANSIGPGSAMAVDRQTISGLGRALKSGETTAEAVLERCLQRIADRNPVLNAFIRVCEDEAREQARQADREIAAGHYRGPLHGVPISLKDLFDLRGTATTAASRVRRDHVAACD